MEPAEIRILLVDDVKAVRLQLESLLQSFGFTRITSVGSVPEAQASLKSLPHDLILCDWHMAPLSGMDLLLEVRANPELKKVPFIMVTAEATRERVLEAIKAGIDDYIVKPLTLTHISKVYRILLKKQVL